MKFVSIYSISSVYTRIYITSFLSINHFVIKADKEEVSNYNVLFI